MPGLNKIEDYLISLGVSYEEPQPGTWLVEDPGKGLPGIVISLRRARRHHYGQGHARPLEKPRGVLLRAPEVELFGGQQPQNFDFYTRKPYA